MKLGIMQPYFFPYIGYFQLINAVDTFVLFNALSGQATIADLSKGVYQSLITSAAGLAVAIPAFILYSYLRTYAKTLMHEMERGGIEIVNIIEDARNNSDIISFSNLQAANESSVEGDKVDKGSISRGEVT